MAWTKRYVRADADGAGDGTTDTNSGANGAWTWAQAIANAAGGQKVIVKGAHGGYSRTTTTDTVTNAGTTTAPIWWAGCNNAEDDLLTDYTTPKPAITYTTGRLITSAFNLVSHLNISGAPTAASLLSAGADNHVYRCRVENTAATSGAYAVQNNAGSNNAFLRNYFKATSTAGRVVNLSSAMILLHNTITGGGSGLYTSGNQNILAFQNLLSSLGSHGVEISAANSGHILLAGNTIVGCGGDGVRLAGALTGAKVLVANVIANNSGWGLNNNSGANIAVLRVANAFYQNTSGEETGFGDYPALLGISESATPFVNSAGGDWSLLLSALSLNAGMGLFENTALTSYLDIGAMQHKQIFIRNGLRGGFIN